MPARRMTVVAAAAVIAAAIAAVGPLADLAHQNPLDSAGTGLALGIPFGAVGVIVALRQARNPVGWLSLAFAACFLVSTDAGNYLIASYRLGRSLPLAPAFLFLQPLWEAALAMLPLMILLFPDGRLPSARWRPALWCYVLLCGVFIAREYTQAAAAIIGGQYPD